MIAFDLFDWLRSHKTWEKDYTYIKKMNKDNSCYYLSILKYYSMHQDIIMNFGWYYDYIINKKCNDV